MKRIELEKMVETIVRKKLNEAKEDQIAIDIYVRRDRGNKLNANDIISKLKKSRLQLDIELYSKPLPTFIELTVINNPTDASMSEIKRMVESIIQATTVQVYAL